MLKWTSCHFHWEMSKKRCVKPFVSSTYFLPQVTFILCWSKLNAAENTCAWNRIRGTYYQSFSSLQIFCTQKSSGSQIMNTDLRILKIKGSLSSSWMNNPIPSLLFPVWQNESLCKTIGMKIYVTCIFICIKIKSLSCETFTTSTCSQKEANGNSEVEVKSAYVPSGPLGQHLFQFL